MATAVAARIREEGGEAMAHAGDAADLDYTTQLVEDTLEEYGRIDGVANFAGILRDGLSYKLTEDDWDSVMRTHLRSHFALLRAVAPHWRAEAGDGTLEPQRSFLGVSSLAAKGNVGQLNYSTAKAGVLGFVRSASSELYRYGVRVNALIPSGFSRMTETVPEEYRPYTRAEMPPERVAPPAAYLLSDAATDVTGLTVHAGGDTIRLLSDPEVKRVGVREGGWTVDSIAEAFEESLTEEFEVTRTDRFF